MSGRTSDRSFVFAAFGKAPLLLVLLLLCVSFASAQFTVTISSVTPNAAPAGSNIAVVGTGYSGTLTASSVVLTLTPVGGGTPLTSNGTSVQTGPGTQRTVNFTVPSPSVGTSLPANYLLTLSGTNNLSQPFTSSNSPTFTMNPAPTLVSVSPAAGQRGQSLSVTINGSFTTFQNGITQARFGQGISVGAGSPGGFGLITVVNATTATANILIDPSATLGVRNVDIQGIENLTLAGGFTVTPIPSTAITLASITPGTERAGASVALTATGFTGTISAGSVTITLTPTGGGAALTATGTSVQVGPGTQRTINFVVPTPPGGTSLPGTYQVSLSGTNTASQPFASTNSLPFTINPNASLVSVNPATAHAGQSINVTINGSFTNFQTGITQARFGPGISVGGGPVGGFGPVTAANGTTATAALVISAGATPGSRTVDVTGVDNVSLANGFTVAAGPSLSIAPSTGQQGQTLQVAITGQNTSFTQGQTQLNLGAGITPSNINVTSGTSLTATLAIAPGAALGPRTVTATTGAEVATLANGFTVAAAGTFQVTLTSITPGAAPSGSSVAVTATGFQGTINPSGVTITLTPAGGGTVLTATGVSVQVGPGTQRTINFVVPATPGGTTLPNAYHVSLSGTNTSSASFTSSNSLAFTIQPAASLSSVNPSTAEQGQSIAVTLTGNFTNFQGGITQSRFGPGISVGGAPAGQFGPVTVLSATTATANLAIDPSAAVGARTVEVSGVENVSLANGFTVTQATTAPTISISPVVGQQGQTLQVSITGENTTFVQGQTTVTFGEGISVSNIVVGSPTALTAILAIADEASLGPRTPTVVTGSQTATLANGFTVTAAPGNPTITVAPSAGQQGQTLQVTITGQNTAFVQGQTSVSFGEGVGVSNVSVVSPGAVTATLSIAAGTPVGPRTVVVTTGVETASLTNGFSVTTAPGNPTITVAPAAGQQGQTIPVTITGQNTSFVQGQTTVSFGDGTTVSNISVTSPTSLTASLAIAGSAAVGPRTIVVATGAQSSTLPNGFTITAAPGNPTITVAPSAGQQDSTLQVTITGQNTSFAQGQTAVSFGDGISITNLAVTSATSLTATLDIAEAAAPGPRTVVVTTGSETATLTNGFTVTPKAGTPTISVSPSTGQQGQTLQVTIAGQNTSFVQGQSSVTFGEGITVSNIVVTNGTSLGATVTIASGASPGTRTVVVTTGSQSATLANGFTVTAAPGNPTISISPSTGQQGQSLQVTITGQNTSFVQGQTAVSFGDGITVSNISVTSPTSATATVAIANGAAAGTRTVIVTTGSQSASLANGFTVTQAPGTATLSVAPNSAQPGQTLAVTITGQNTAFSQGQTTVSFGDGITVSNLTVVSPTSATATLAVSPSAPLGFRTVIATTGSQVATLANGFTVGTPAGSILSVLPNSGQQGQTLAVTVTGSGTSFVQGQTTLNFGDGIGVSSVIVTSPTSLSAMLTISSQAATGPRTVSVTTGSEVATLPNGFIVNSAPRLLSITPNVFRQGESGSATITGQATNFVNGNVQVTLGNGVTVQSVTVNSATSITIQWSVAVGASPGARTLNVVTGGQTLSLENAVTISTSGVSLGGVSPSSGARGQTLNVTITGQNTGFVQGTSQVSFGSGITVTSVSVTNSTSLTAQITIAANADLGSRTVTVTTGQQIAAFAQGFVVTAATSSTGQPLTCATAAGVPPLLRAEGLTELVGDIVLHCTGGIQGEIRLVNLQVFFNAPVTSRLLGSGTSEALLIVDELGELPGQTGATPAVYRGQQATLDGGVLWTGVTVVAPGSGTRTLRITNVRVNAATLGASNTLIPNQVVAFLSASPSQSLAINNPQQTVGFIQRGLDFAVQNCAGTETATIGFAQCVGQNNSGGRNLTGGAATGEMQFSVRFSEGFQTAFKPRVAPGQVPSVVGNVYNSESGFVRATTDLPYAIGGADSGTRLSLRFRNLPAGIRLFVTTAPSIGSSEGISAVLVQTDLSGAGASAGGLPAVAATTNLLCASSTREVPAVEISVVNGTALAVWEVTAANQSLLESLTFGVAVAYTPDLANRQPAVGTATVAGNFAPFYTTEAGGRASAGLPIPRFVDQPITRNAFAVNACVTNLLFPFVTNRSGFDTGLAIANTSRDNFASPGQRLQAGACTIHYFGDTAGGAAPSPQKTTTPVAAGETLTFVVSSGGNFGIAGTPGFQGYIFAQCEFQFAHGFAFITDGPVGAARVAEGYLALIVDNPGVSRSAQAAENLSH